MDILDLFFVLFLFSYLLSLKKKAGSLSPKLSNFFSHPKTVNIFQDASSDSVFQVELFMNLKTLQNIIHMTYVHNVKKKRFLDYSK